MEDTKPEFVRQGTYSNVQCTFSAHKRQWYKILITHLKKQTHLSDRLIFRDFEAKLRSGDLRFSLLVTRNGIKLPWWSFVRI